VIGADTVMAAGCMIAGSTTVGERCVFAGQVGISGHLAIGDEVRLGGGTVVLKDIPHSGEYMGHPLMEKRQFLRLLRKLRGMVERPEPGTDGA
jgi:UDP-3-O-[3-hydroxymyristoyl] glucosamine N-acyltransferase